ncbi:uncharacterized protein NPIL_17061 [Nephila pilipes]|uniref:Uncharacterized protein n=1 Tax=Nephila pilipes TaxID=299642 RepID=A0A8X6TN68_NEPPI|nr:uncharacterized protein NPIL_17061 [Nephila pilipes]
MDSTVCIFNTGKGGCGGRKNNHLQNLICEKHLKDYFGLELYHSYVETPTEVLYAGWILKPTAGVFFKPNDVILPVRLMYDKVYRSNQVVRTEADSLYKINPRTDEFMRVTLSEGKFAKSDRLIYEIIRNLSETSPNINVNPSEHCENDPKPIAYIRSKMAVSETFIQKLTTMNYINNITLPLGKETPMTELGDLSLSYKFIMSRMEYSSHVAEDLQNQTKELPRLMYNAVYVPDVGVVAVADISDPDVIVLHGSSRGVVSPNDYGYYDEMVISHPKEVLYPKFSPHRMTAQNSVRRAFTSSCI